MKYFGVFTINIRPNTTDLIIIIKFFINSFYGYID